MTTQKLLNELLNDLASLTGNATTESGAIDLGKSHYLAIENAPVYGGYRIINVGVSNGAHYGAFGGNSCEGRVSGKVMEVKLRALIAGAEYAIKNLIPA